MSETLISKRAVRAHFGRAAPSYAAAAALQHAVEDQLLESLDALKSPPMNLLDVGCGPGRSTQILQAQFPSARVVALDFALPMLQQFPKKMIAKRFWNPLRRAEFVPVQRVVGDASELPICQDVMDVLFSNLCIQWCSDMPKLFSEWRRVMRTGGLLLFSSFGPDTLMELRQAWSRVDQGMHVNPFFDMHDVGDALLRAGFRDPVLRTERYTLTYPNVMALLQELKSIGATNALSQRRAGLGGKAAIAQMMANYPADADGRISASYEVVFAQAFAPPAGAPIRAGGAEIASVPVHAITRSVRRTRTSQ